MGSENVDKLVHIKLHSSIQHPGQKKELHKQMIQGKQIVKNGTFYLQYTERQDGAEIQSIIKLGAKEALIMRSGAVQMRLPFAEGEERIGQYKTTHLAMQLRVKTNQLQFEEGADGGTFVVKYQLFDGQHLLGTYELQIIYTEGTL